MRRLFRRRINESEIEVDVENYLAEKTEALIASGLSPREAQRKARSDFGNVTRIKELSREEWRWGMLEQTGRDVRYAFRSLRRNPAFAATAILTLALGIGANAAIFNLLHAVILRTLPVPNAEQLRLLSVVGPQTDDTPSIFSYPVLGEMQAATNGKASLSGFARIAPVKTGEAEQAGAQLVSGNFFETLQVEPEAGRLLTGADDKLSGAYPVVLSDAYWSKHFGRNPGAIGQSIRVNETPVTIVGVAPRSFFGLSPGSRPDFWLPVSAQFDLRYQRNVWNSNADIGKPFLPQRGIRWLAIVARVYAHAAERQTAAAVNRVYALDMKREVKGWPNDPVGARNLLESRVHLEAGEKGLGDLRGRFSEPLTVLMCAAGMVLLIASVNLASLALARAIARRKEIAVRCSIGASRGRIVSQFASEILILSLAGGLAAIPVALGASRLLMRWASNGHPMPLDIGLDPPVMLFVVLASVFAGFVFGMLPAWEAVNFSLADAMKAHASAVKGMRLPWGRTLIAIQVMFSFVLLTGAVLFVRTFLNYASIHLGFAPEHVLSLQVDPLGAGYSTGELLPLYRKVLERVKDVPGVQSASFAQSCLAAGCKGTNGIVLQRHPGGEHSLQYNGVSPEYFDTVGMRLMAGRLFDRHDLGNKPVLAVINETAAREFFPDVNPLGQFYGYGGDTGRFQVIGVIADARVIDVHEKASPMAYYSLEQTSEYAGSLEIRVQGDPKAFEQAIRTAVHTSAPALPVMQIRLLTEKVSSNLLREVLVARLASSFAVLALALACLGVYGVLSYAITRRTSEIGIRLALGAEVNSVRWMVLREALSVIAIGLALGIPIAVGCSRLIRGLLYAFSPGDPTSIGLGAAMLVAIGFAAAFVPAWRASRVDPNVALRYE